MDQAKPTAGGRQDGTRAAYPANPWLILVVLVMGLFMILLDATIVNIAIPHIMAAFNTGLSNVEWVIDAYVLSFAVTLITLGRFGDLYGRRLLFVGGLAVFTASSLACGLSPSIAWLIAFRVLQGFGGAAIMPASLSLVAEVFPPEQRGAAMGIWGGIAGLATAVGPTLGGTIVQSASWNWIFFINVPVGIAVILLAVRLVPESRNPGAVQSLDMTGVALVTVSMFSLTFALIEGQRYGWGSAVILGLFALFAVSLALLCLRELSARQPLIDLNLFRIRNFLAGNVTGILLTFSMVGAFFTLPIFLQDVIGFSALRAGLTLTPMSATIMLSAPLAGRLADRFGSRWLIAGGMLAVAIGAAWISGLIPLLGGLDPQTSTVSLVLPLLLTGLGIGFSIAPTTTVVMASAPADRIGNASGILSTFRRLGNVMGIAVLGAVMQNRIMADVTTGLTSLPQISPGVKQSVLDLVGGSIRIGLPQGLDKVSTDQLTGLLESSFAGAINTTFRAAAGVALLGAIAALFLKSHVQKHQPGG